MPYTLTNSTREIPVVIWYLTKSFFFFIFLGSVLSKLFFTDEWFFIEKFYYLRIWIKKKFKEFKMNVFDSLGYVEFTRSRESELFILNYENFYWSEFWNRNNADYKIIKIYLKILSQSNGWTKVLEKMPGLISNKRN